jgi:hypothetical protein
MAGPLGARRPASSEPRHDRPAAPARPDRALRSLGVDDTIRFIEEFGGVEIYIARNPTARSRIVKLLGREKAEALAQLAEGGEWPARIPLVKPWVAAVLKAKGLPVSDIARILRTTDVTVRKYLNPAPIADPRQPRLF